MGSAGLNRAFGILLGWLILLAGLSLPVPAAASETRAEAASVAELVSCVTPVRPGDSPAALLDTPSRFACGGAQSALGPGSYWLRLELPADRPPGEALFSFIPAWQHSAELFYRGQDGALHAVALTNRDLSRFGRIGARSVVPLGSDLAPGGALLMRIDGALNASGLLQMPELVSEEAADHQELGEAMVYALFCGLGLALLSYNFLMWLAMRERFQLYYCMTVTAMLAYAFSHSGMLDLAWPMLGAQFRLRFSYVPLGLIGASAQLFLVTCIEPGLVSRRVLRLVRLSAAALAVSALAVALAPFSWAHWLDRAYVLAFIPIPVLMVTAAVQAWRGGSRIVRLLALAWFFPLVMCVVRIAHAANLIGFSLLVEHSVIVAMSLEALLTATAVSFRIKRIARERDTARAEEAVARRLADVDPLTGLLNRRALLANALDWDSAEPLRLVLVDIDHFKAINDRYGHDRGDEVLREVAQVLARSAEIRATVARLGGEEFALLGTADELTPDFAERLLANVRDQVMPGGVRVTISIGMASGPMMDEADWRRLYKAADAALYAAKHGGRDRLCEAREAEGPVAAAA